MLHPDDVKIAVVRLREDANLNRYRGNMRQATEAEREVYNRDASAYERVADHLETEAPSE